MEETATPTLSALRPTETEPFPQVPPALAVAEVRAHPNFAATRRRFLLAFTTDPQARGNSAAMRLLSDPGRIALFSMIVSLYFEYEPAEPPGPRSALSAVFSCHSACPAHAGSTPYWHACKASGCSS